MTAGAVAGPKGLEDMLERMTAIAAGPGMGTGAGAKKTLDWILDNWNGPLLLDADAINLLAGTPERLADREVPAVLTPHPGELARLLGTIDREGARRSAGGRTRSGAPLRRHRRRQGLRHHHRGAGWSGLGQPDR